MSVIIIKYYKKNNSVKKLTKIFEFNINISNSKRETIQLN